MKWFKIALIALVMLVNLAISRPTLAEPNYFDLMRNPEYTQVTQQLNEWMAKDAQNATPEEMQAIQNQIMNLQMQKYALETGENWGQCFNMTGHTLAIYGKDKSVKKRFPFGQAPSSMYYLASGQATDDEWDCDGVYIPAEVKVAALEPADGQARGPVAAATVDGSQLMVMSYPGRAEWSLSLAPAQIYQPGAQWDVPNFTQAMIDRQFPNAPIND
ncbi:MAG: hypothetical protein KME16_00755 [Scytolyngbya sp. HA4215-MV1]|jgi:hypothetical protein|nr:hypothetical protein [Scytolyngbya sp. HA4215-MV1]